MKKTIKTTLPVNNGLFSLLSTPEITFPDGTDILYIFQRSGDKYISNYLEYFLNEAGELTQEKLQSIATTIQSLYAENWKRIYAALFADYNPIDNYVREEEWTESKDRTAERNGNGTTQTQFNGTNNDNTYGFNSSVPTPQTSRTENNTSSGTSEVSENNEENETLDRKISARGNIGITTTQSMIKQELDLRTKHFYELVFSDVDKLLTVSTYESY